MLANILSIISISLTGAMSPGPMTAVNITKAIESPYAGIKIALGHAVVEFPLMCLVFFGLGQFFENEIVQLILFFAGGSMIIFMGYSMIKDRDKDLAKGKISKYSAFTSGIIMSILNPYFIVWWVTVGGLLLMEFMDGIQLALIPVFYLSHWICDLIWMELLAIIVYKTKSYLGNALQNILFWVSGLFLIVFGIYFYISGIKLLV